MRALGQSTYEAPLLPLLRRKMEKR